MFFIQFVKNFPFCLTYIIILTPIWRNLSELTKYFSYDTAQTLQKNTYTRSNYTFKGWNTKKDGSGEYYSENSTIHLTENLYLYAQWADESTELLEIRIISDWPKGKIGYVGAKITLTAELTGFNGKEYTLQWQYTTDPESDNWTNVPDAHEINYTYILDETTTNYTWRCVAQDIR